MNEELDYTAVIIDLGNKIAQLTINESILNTTVKELKAKLDKAEQELYMYKRTEAQNTEANQEIPSNHITFDNNLG